MKVKALRYKKEFNDFQEFVQIEEIGGEPMVFTSEIPKLHPETVTIEGLREYMEKNEDYYEGLDFDLDKLEFVEFELIETGVVGADIRNKLSPPKNLVAMLEDFFDDNVADAPKEREKLVEFIKKEMKQTEVSVEYLANLL